MKINTSAILLLACLTACHKKAPPPTPPSYPVTAAKVVQCDAPIYLEYVGHLDPNIRVEVRSQVAGTITDVHFNSGQKVKAGDPLLSIDSRPYIADLAKAEAQLAKDLATLKYSEEKTKRYSKLVQDDFVSKLDFDQYISNALESEATVKLDLAQIETAKINLDYCSINSPVDGVTSNLKIKLGNYVQVGVGSDPLLVVNQIKPILVSFYVPDIDLPRIQEKQNLAPLMTHVYLNENPNEAYEGTLILINNEVNQPTGSILLQATLPNENEQLWPGEFVDVRLILEMKKDALMIPTTAVQISNEGYYVFVVKPDKTIELRTITLEQKQELHSIVKTGLSKDELVVTEGQLNLYPDAHVQVKEAPIL